MPKIIGGSLEEHRSETRRRVFDAFADLMLERSYDAISLAEIASRAGLGRTALYNHFADKESVVLAFAMDETSRYVETLEGALEGVEAPTDQLRTYVRQHIRLAKVFHLGFGPELYAMLSQPSLAQIREHVVLVEGVLRRILAGGVTSGDFAEQDLDTAVALVHACLQGRNVPDDEGPARARAIAATEDFVLRAVGVPVEHGAARAVGDEGAGSSG